MVKSVKLQFRQCHSNKYTGLFLCLSPPVGRLSGGGIYEFSGNFNRSVLLGCAGSHIHVNMNMKMTGCLSDMGCKIMCSGLWIFSIIRRTCDYMCPHAMAEFSDAVCRHPRLRLPGSTFSYSPTHCQVPLA